jgi:hypothetical protein
MPILFLAAVNIEELVFKIVAEGPALLLQASRIGLVIQLFNLVQQVKFLRFLILSHIFTPPSEILP